jgi:hypothetical protein
VYQSHFACRVGNDDVHVFRMAILVDFIESSKWQPDTVIAEKVLGWMCSLPHGKVGEPYFA